MLLANYKISLLFLLIVIDGMCMISQQMLGTWDFQSSWFDTNQSNHGIKYFA